MRKIISRLAENPCLIAHGRHFIPGSMSCGCVFALTNALLYNSRTRIPVCDSALLREVLCHVTTVLQIYIAHFSVTFCLVTFDFKRQTMLREKKTASISLRSLSDMCRLMFSIVLRFLCCVSGCPPTSVQQLPDVIR